MPHKPSSRLTLMKLEPRILFDGAAAASVMQASADTPDASSLTMDNHGADWRTIDSQQTSEHGGSNDNGSSRQEIAFIDATLPDAGQLAQSLPANAEIIWLQPDSDPWQQMNAALQGRSGISAVHLFSHGNDGEIILAGRAYGSERLAGTSFEHWRSALTADADLLLYGCDVAASTRGEQLVLTLAELTGADVAASRDDTGNAGGNWQLEYASGPIEALALEASGYGYNLTSIALNGSAGWVPIMYGTGRDPQGDSQAGAADTDIIGDATHGSLYTAYSDNGTPDDPSDDYLYFRLRIDNPTNSTTFGGVAIVGLDANQDGRIDLFISVDGRNNTQAVRLLDPGTGANISPSTTTTSPLPTGWLPNNGVYPFQSGVNYSVVAVSAATDPNWSPSQMNPATGQANDLSGDGKIDVFVSWRVPVADLATVLAKASPVDRNGNLGPRGSTGIQGFGKDTVVQYVSFTQTQPGPINGDLNGVGRSYDKNATFASLGAFTAPMSASNPVSAGPGVQISGPLAGDDLINASEGSAFGLGGTATANAWIRLSIDDTDNAKAPLVAWVQADAIGNWNLAGLDLNGLSEGALQIDAQLVEASGNHAPIAGAVSDSYALLYDRTPPSIGIQPLASAGYPTLVGTSSGVPAGSYITVTIDDQGRLLSYLALVGSGGAWSVNTAVQAPSSGSLPAGGLSAAAKVSAFGSDAAGNTGSTTALHAPTVRALTTNDTTPLIGGTWVSVPGDVLSVSVNGNTYSAGDGHLSTSGNTWSLVIPAGDALGVGTYEVAARVSRGAESIGESTSNELVISDAPVITVGITSASSSNELWPVISGTSQNAGGYVIVRIDPNDDGDLSDAVTHSVATDGSGNWTLNTATAQPIAGHKPSGGYAGANGVRVTDSTGSEESSQTLTVTIPTLSLGSIETTVTSGDSTANVITGDGKLNALEASAVRITGTTNAADGSQIKVTITDQSNNVLQATAVVSAGQWSLNGLDLRSFDNGQLSVKAVVNGTGIEASGSVLLDKTPPRIFNTGPDLISRQQPVFTGVSQLANTSLLVSVYSQSGSFLNSQTVTTDANGNWQTSNFANLGNAQTTGATVTVRVTSSATDDAGNKALMSERIHTAGNGQGGTGSLVINTIAGDDIIEAHEIGSGLTITGTTSLTAATASNFTVTVHDANGNGVTIPAARISVVSGNWSATLTNAELQTLGNGALEVSVKIISGGSEANAVHLPSLALDSPVLTISDNTPGTATGAVLFTFSFSEAVSGFDASDIVVSGGSKGDFSVIDAKTYTLSVTPTPGSSGDISVSVASGAAKGSVTGRNNVGDSALQGFDTTGAAAPPSLTLNTDALASSRTPLLSGTSSLAPGAPILVAIDLDNDGTIELTYSATVQGDGSWRLDIASATPVSGSFPATGLPSDARIVASATNGYGNSTTVTGHNIPAVDNLLSNSATPTVSGRWTNLAGDSLSVQLNGATYSAGSGLVIDGNRWQLIPGSSLADGTYQVIATVSRAGSDKVDISSGELVIDRSAPAVAITAISNDSGLAGDFITQDKRLVFSGSAEADSTVLVSLHDAAGALLFSSSLVAADGSWTIDRSALAPLADGRYTLTATATDRAGNSASATQALVIDSSANIATLNNYRTSSSTPLLIGSTDIEAGRNLSVTVAVSGGPSYQYTTTVAADGSWRVDTLSQTPAGESGPVSFANGSTLEVSISGSDLAGNQASNSRTLLIDTNAPSIKIDGPLDSPGNHDGTLTADEDRTVVIAGSSTFAPAGSQLQVSITDGVTTISDTTLIQANGTWALEPLNLRGLGNGTITVTATYVDDAGNSFSDIASVQHDKSGGLTIDSISDDSGVLGDFITRDNTLVFRGSATAGESVTVQLNGATLGTVVADSRGIWQYDHSAVPLADGTYSLSVAIGAGTPATQTITVDSLAPTGTLTVDALETDSTTPILTGTAQLAAGEILQVSVNGHTYRLGDGHLSHDAGTWTLQIPSSLALAPASGDFDGRYEITAEILDTAGNRKLDSSSYELRISTDASAPQIDLAPGDATTLNRSLISRHGGPLSLDDDSNPATLLENSDRITALTITVNGLLDGASEKLIFGSHETAADGSGGSLDAIHVGGVTLSIAYSSGTFTLQRADYTALSAAQAQAIIRDVQYRNAAVTPTDGARHFVFGASDDAGNVSAPASLTLTLDTAAPAAPGVALTSDSGSSNNDAITNNGAYSVGGLESGASVEYSSDGSTWSSVKPAAVEGNNSIRVRQTDLAGNVSGVSTLSFTLDTAAPVAPTVTALATGSRTPSIGGTAAVAAGEHLSVTVNGVRYNEGTDLVRNGNNWNLTIPAGNALGTGVYAVTATVADLAGNTSSDVTSNELMIVDAPAQTLTIVGMGKDTGSSASDFITRDGSANRDVFGTLTAPLGANEVVEVSSDGGSNWTAATTSDTTWSATDSSSHAGDWVIQARVRNTLADLGGNVASQAVVLDTGISAPGFALINDDGSSNTDGISSDGSIGVTLADEAVSWQYSLDSGSNWVAGSASRFVLPLGSYPAGSIQVRQYDTAGNLGTASNKTAIEIRVTRQEAPPAPTLLPSTPSRDMASAGQGLALSSGPLSNVNAPGMDSAVTPSQYVLAAVERIRDLEAGSSASAYGLQSSSLGAGLGIDTSLHVLPEVAEVRQEGREAQPLGDSLGLDPFAIGQEVLQAPSDDTETQPSAEGDAPHGAVLSEPQPQAQPAAGNSFSAQLKRAAAHLASLRDVENG